MHEIIELAKTAEPPWSFEVKPALNFLNPKLIATELVTAAEYPKSISPAVC
jgi:hypothetical protein